MARIEKDRRALFQHPGEALGVIRMSDRGDDQHHEVRAIDRLRHVGGQQGRHFAALEDAARVDTAVFANRLEAFLAARMQPDLEALARQVGRGGMAAMPRPHHRYRPYIHAVSAVSTILRTVANPGKGSGATRQEAARWRRTDGLANLAPMSEAQRDTFPMNDRSTARARLAGAMAYDPELAARYRGEGLWRDELLTDWLDRTVARTPDATAIVTAGGKMSFAELAAMSDRLASGFRRLGIGMGDVVGVQLRNGPLLGRHPCRALPHRRGDDRYPPDVPRIGMRTGARVRRGRGGRLRNGNGRFRHRRNHASPAGPASRAWTRHCRRRRSGRGDRSRVPRGRAAIRRGAGGRVGAVHHALHLGLDQPAQGGAAQPQQPADQRPGKRRGVRNHPPPTGSWRLALSRISTRCTARISRF